MQFFSTLLVGAAALASFVAAQSNTLVITSEISSVIAGRPVTIEYTSDDLNEPVTIDLRYGETGDLTTAETITTSATGGSFTWTPSTSLENRADYTFEIRQGSETNFAPVRFELTGGSDEAASSSAASSTPASTVVTSAVTTEASSVSTGIASSTILTTFTTAPNATAPVTTSSTRPTPSATEPTESASAPSGAPGEGAASTLASPIALMIGAIAAFAYLQ